MGVVFTNNAETTLAAAITSTSATSISVTSSSTFPTVGAGEYFYATITDGTNLEIVKITAVSGTTWTVVRASDNTTARTFANGSTVQLRTTAALLTDIQENIASKSANQTVYNATAASSATAYDVGINPGVEANAMVFLDGVMQHHDTFSFSGSTLTFDAAPTNGTKIEVIVDNLINLQSSNLTVDTFTATSNQTAFTLSDSPAAEANLIVFINGVFQNQAAYTISNNTLTLDTGVVTGRTVTVYVINPVNIGTPSDGTVTSAKLSGNITTPGTLTVGSHDVAFDSPTFVVDNSNSRVGLGTASPSVPVDIVGDVKMSANLTVDTTTLVVDSSNNKVGIGETSPANNLHIGIDSGGEGILVKSTGDHSAMLQFNVNRGNGNRAIAQLNGLWNGTSVADIQLKTGGDTTNKDDGEITFHTSSADNIAERMRIDSSGNIGIGTTSPSATDWGSASPVLQLSGTQPLLSLKDTDTGEWQIANSGQTLYFWSTTTDKQYTFPATGGRINMTDANGNVAIGHEALNVIAANSGDSCTAMGYQALEKVTDGIHNTGVGYRTGMNILGGGYNVLMGNFAGDAITSGSSNSCFGYGAGGAITTGVHNVAVGRNALDAEDEAGYNTAIGNSALTTNNGGARGVAVGYGALQDNSTGDDNVGIGVFAGQNITTASDNTCVGNYSGNDMTEGHSNSLLGYKAGQTITTGDGNVIMGYLSDAPADTNHTIVLGYDVTGSSSTTTIGSGSSDIRASHGSATWATVSDERVKKDIKDAEAGLSFINDLRPVTFNYKAKGDLPEEFNGYEKDSTEPYKFSTTNHGFIAQEVKETIDNHPEIKDGFKMWDVRETGQQEVGETAVIPILVKAVQELSTQVQELKAKLESE